MGAAAGCQALIERDAELPVVPNYRQLRDYRAVCEAGHTPACERLTRLEAADAAFAHEVLDAIRSQDADAPGSGVVMGSMLFRSPPYRNYFHK